MPSYLRENIKKKGETTKTEDEQIRDRGWYEKKETEIMWMENIKERFTENAPIQEYGKQQIKFLFYSLPSSLIIGY